MQSDAHGSVIEICGVSVGVGVELGVDEGVFVGVGLGVGEGVLLGVFVGVLVGVGLGVGEGVGLDVGLGVGLGVGVGVWLGVGVGVISQPQFLPSALTICQFATKWPAKSLFSPSGWAVKSSEQETCKSMACNPGEVLRSTVFPPVQNELKSICPSVY